MFVTIGTIQRQKSYKANVIETQIYASEVYVTTEPFISIWTLCCPAGNASMGTHRDYS